MKKMSLPLVLCIALFLNGCGSDGNDTPTPTEAAFPASLQSFVVQEDVDDDGFIDEVHSFEATYDGNGRISESRWECDHDFNGTIDNREFFIYNDGEKMTQEYFFFDDDDDYLIDSTETGSYSYDSEGRLVEKVLNTDLGQDGEIDVTATYTYAYDPDGNRIEKTKEQVEDGGSSGYTEIYAYSFSADGKLDEFTVIKSDPDAPTDEVTTYSFAYDANGNVEEMVVSTDSDDDGNPDSIRTTTFTYLDASHLDSITEEIDNDGDGDSEIQYEQVVTYDAKFRPIQVEVLAVNLVDDAVVLSGSQLIAYSADDKEAETQVTVDKDGDGTVDYSAIYELSFSEAGMTNRVYAAEVGPNVTVPVPLVVAINEGEFPF